MKQIYQTLFIDLSTPPPVGVSYLEQPEVAVHV